MGTGTRADYARAFVERHAAPGQAVLNEPGMYGALPVDDAPRARLLITDDRSYDQLVALLPRIHAGVIDVFTEATRSTELLRAHLPWRTSTATAMTCCDLRAVPEPRLVPELACRPVRRLPSDPATNVPLADAVTVAIAAKQTPYGPPSPLVGYLKSLPAAYRLFAAVDGGGASRATSGVGVFGSHATVVFINTAPAWRRQGVGTAMTAGALHAARTAGAKQAHLNASDAGLAIYHELGFESVARTTRFLSPD